MKKTFLQAAALIATMILSIGCERDEERGIMEVDQVAEFFENNKTAEPQRFRVSANSETTITGDEGTKVLIPVDAFIKSDGSSVTGSVDFDLLEVFSKQDIIYSGRPTITTDGQILESNGEFLFSATQDGETLRLAKELFVEVPNSEADEEMELFIGSETSNGFAWSEADIDSFFVSRTAGYFFKLDTLTWINIDKYLTTSNATDVDIYLPDGYEQEKTKVYMLFDNTNTVLGVNPFSGSVNHKRYRQSGINVGEEITVLVVSEKDNWLHYSKTSVTVAEDQRIDITMQRATEDELRGVIAEL